MVVGGVERKRLLVPSHPEELCDDDSGTMDGWANIRKGAFFGRGVSSTDGGLREGVIHDVVRPIPGDAKGVAKGLDDPSCVKLRREECANTLGDE